MTFTDAVSATDAFQVRYASNLNIGDAVINLTNTGRLNGLDPAGRISSMSTPLIRPKNSCPAAPVKSRPTG